MGGLLKVISTWGIAPQRVFSLVKAIFWSLVCFEGCTQKKLNLSYALATFSNKWEEEIKLSFNWDWDYNEVECLMYRMI